MKFVEKLNLERLKPDFLRPSWRCTTCGTTYRRNRRTCKKCEGTVFEQVR